MPSIELSSISTESNTNCLLFFYFFIGCYILCVCFLIYTLLRLFKYYLRQKRINSITNETINNPSTTTTVLLKIHHLSEQDTVAIRSELDLLQPLIIQTLDLPPIYIENNLNQSPPDYKEHL